MADPTFNQTLEGRPGAGERRSYVVANGVTIYGGALVGVLASGYAGYWNNIATTRAVGVAQGEVTGNTSATPAPRVEVSHGDEVVADVAGADDIGDVGALVYSQDGNITSLTLTPATSQPIGIITEWESATRQYVRLFTPAELEAKVDQA